MSEVETNSKTKIHKLPFVIKKDSIKSGPHSLGLSFRCYSSATGNVIKEDIIYKAKAGDFLNGKYPDLCIINRLDLTQNSSRTIASYTASTSGTVKLTSDAVVKLIGQANYDQVFVSLCCVINQELKIKGILSLLCASADIEHKKNFTVATQTYESSYSDLMKEKKRKSIKSQSRRNKVRPYVVKVEDSDDYTVKKVVIHPGNLKNVENVTVRADNTRNEIVPIRDASCTDIKIENNSIDSGYSAGPDNYLKPCQSNNDSFPELRDIVNEDSNISDADSIGNLSISSSINLIDIENKAKSLLNYIDDHTELNELDHEGEKTTIVMTDGSKVTVRGNPDPFHIAMPDILKDLSATDQRKLLFHQAYLDWKYCLQPDEYKNFPIHLAVLNNDLELLRRQCLVLKSRQETVDILAAGELTALQMAIFEDRPECTALLLAHGADVFVRDDECRTPLHLAAEIGDKHVEAILAHCRNNARKILKENEDLWKPELENKPDDKLINYLLTQISTMCDNQGYTPLMLASKVGNAGAVRLLVAAAPSIVNMAMPTCGNTALYLAASTACMEAANRGNKLDVAEKYMKTVEFLLQYGADLAIDNNSGSNVNVLLAELQDVTMSSFIANKLTEFKGYGPGTYMLVKDDDGNINTSEVTRKVYKNKKLDDKATLSTKNDKGNVNTNVKSIVGDKATLNSKKDNGNVNTNVTSNVEDKATLDTKNDKANIATKSNENVDTNRSSNETDKPKILKNLPVITKIVSLTKNKPILIKGILPKQGADNEGLQTKITAKSINTNIPTLTTTKSSNANIPTLTTAKSSNANIQTLTTTKSSNANIPTLTTTKSSNANIPTLTTTTALKFVKILPKTEAPKTNDISIKLPKKKKPVILRQVKRTKRSNDGAESNSSCSKKVKPSNT